MTISQPRDKTTIPPANKKQALLTIGELKVCTIARKWLPERTHQFSIAILKAKDWERKRLKNIALHRMKIDRTSRKKVRTYISYPIYPVPLSEHFPPSALRHESDEQP